MEIFSQHRIAGLNPGGYSIAGRKCALLSRLKSSHGHSGPTDSQYDRAFRPVSACAVPFKMTERGARAADWIPAFAGMTVEMRNDGENAE